MIGFEAGHLVGGQLVPPGSHFASTKEIPARTGTRRLTKPALLLLLAQLREVSRGHGAPDVVLGRRTPGEGEHQA